MVNFTTNTYEMKRDIVNFSNKILNIMINMDTKDHYVKIRSLFNVILFFKFIITLKVTQVFKNIIMLKIRLLYLN